MNHIITRPPCQLPGTSFDSIERLSVGIFFPSLHHASHRDQTQTLGNDAIKIVGVELNNGGRNISNSASKAEHSHLLLFSRSSKIDNDCCEFSLRRETNALYINVTCFRQSSCPANSQPHIHPCVGLRRLGTRWYSDPTIFLQLHPFESPTAR